MDEVLKNQNYQCAKKPYNRIDGLRGYSCPLWRNNKNQYEGYIIGSEYHIIKNNKNFPNKIKNFFILCQSCYKKFLSGIPKKDLCKYEVNSSDCEINYDIDEPEPETKTKIRNYYNVDEPEHKNYINYNSIIATDDKTSINYNGSDIYKLNDVDNKNDINFNNFILLDIYEKLNYYPESH